LRERQRVAAVIVFVLVLAAAGCLFNKKKKQAGPQYPTSPVRLAALPLNLPSDSDDLRWLSLGMVALVGKEAEGARDLEVIPAWQALPVAVESLGASRSLTDETAAYIANRLGARWAVYGELRPAKEGLELLIDFIPAKTSQVAYRYRKSARVEQLSAHIREALTQFLNYIIARPLAGKDRSALAIYAAELKEVASALDREHGWFQTAEPGKAEKAFTGLQRKDDKLARLLFNPGLYQPQPARPAAPGAAGPAHGPRSAVEEPSAPAPIHPSDTARPDPEPRAAAEARTPPPPREFPAPARAPAVPLSSTTAPAPAEAIFAAAPAIPQAAPALPAGRAAAAASAQPSTETAARPSQAPSRLLPRARAPLRLQVLSTPRRSEAEDKAAELQRAGYKAVVEPADLGERGTWYRLRLMGFQAAEEATAAGKRLQSEGLIREFWIVR
jgi:hypothetical protein